MMMKRIVELICAAAVAVCTIFPAYAQNETPAGAALNERSYEYVLGDYAAPYTEYTAEDAVEGDAELFSNSDSLEENADEIEEAIISAARQGVSQIDLSSYALPLAVDSNLNVTDDYGLGQFYTNITSEHPELFHMYGYSIGYSYYQIGGVPTGEGIVRTLSIISYNGLDGIDIPSAIEELEQKAEDIAAEIIPSGINEYEAMLLVHDYIVDNNTYDTAGLNAELAAGQTSYTHSAYKALMEGTSVCDGYLKAFKLIMDKAGWGDDVYSVISNSMGHAWNMVKLGDNYYHIDATWDDPTSNGEDAGICDHQYFLICDDTISEDHYSWSIYDGSSYTCDDDTFESDGFAFHDPLEYSEVLVSRLYSRADSSSSYSTRTTKSTVTYDFTHEGVFKYDNTGKVFTRSLQAESNFTDYAGMGSVDECVGESSFSDCDSWESSSGTGGSADWDSPDHTDDGEGSGSLNLTTYWSSSSSSGTSSAVYNELVPVTGNNMYTYSVYAAGLTSFYVSGRDYLSRANVVIEYLDSDGNVLSTSDKMYADASTELETVGGYSWGNITVSIPAPKSAVNARITFNNDGLSSIKTGSVSVYFDDLTVTDNGSGTYSLIQNGGDEMDLLELTADEMSWEYTGEYESIALNGYTPAPTSAPTSKPTSAPTASPTPEPLEVPTATPTAAPTATTAPTATPTAVPTATPTAAPTATPTASPETPDIEDVYVTEPTSGIEGVVVTTKNLHEASFTITVNAEETINADVVAAYYDSSGMLLKLASFRISIEPGNTLTIPLSSLKLTDDDIPQNAYKAKILMWQCNDSSVDIMRPITDAFEFSSGGIITQ